MEEVYLYRLPMSRDLEGGWRAPVPAPAPPWRTHTVQQPYLRRARAPSPPRGGAGGGDLALEGGQLRRLEQAVVVEDQALDAQAERRRQRGPKGVAGQVGRPGG